jgi:cyclohexadieny/prephenate dehydrogenase
VSPLLPPGPLVVVGLGALGTAVAARARETDPGRTLVGVDSDPRTATRALDAGVVDRLDPSGADAVLDAGVVVFAAPLEALPAFLVEVGPLLARRTPGSVITTDTVGVNGPVLARVRGAGLADRWVTAIPLVTTAASGPGAMDPERFVGAELLLSTAEEATPDTLDAGSAFWQALGARTSVVEARDADIRVAWTVLLPQLVANALAGALHAAGVPREDLGPEASAMVALAATDPARWTALLEATAPATGTGIGSVARALRVVGDLMARREVDRVAEFMERTRGWAEDVPAPAEADS